MMLVLVSYLVLRILISVFGVGASVGCGNQCCLYYFRICKSIFGVGVSVDMQIDIWCWC